MIFPANMLKLSPISLSRNSSYIILQNRIYNILIANLRCEYGSFKNTINDLDESNVAIQKSLYIPIQKENFKNKKKVSVIGGGGNIGQVIGFNLLLNRFCNEIVLFDTPKNKALYGIALDMLGGMSCKDYPNIKVSNEGVHTKDSDLIIICAGKGVAKGQTRLDSLQENVDIFRGLIPKLTYLSPKCVMLVVTNPVDLMAYAAWKFSGFPYYRVIGTGTELDSSRFKFFLSKKFDISPKSINAWMIGEHGLSCVPCWSTVNIAGTRIKDINSCFGSSGSEEWSKLEEDVKQSANVIKTLKGYTSYSISMTTSCLAQAILTDANTVHTISTLCDGIHGFKVKSFMSLPAVIGSSGVKFIIRQVLDCQEKENLIKSAAILDKALCSIKW